VAARHLLEAELFFIYAGEIVFTADGVTRTIGAGESVFVRCVVHAYRNGLGRGRSHGRGLHAGGHGGTGSARSARRSTTARRHRRR
jgi:hypothetical protein